MSKSIVAKQGAGQQVQKVQMDGMEKEIRKEAKFQGASKEHIERVIAHWNQPSIRKEFQKEWPNYADYPLRNAAITYLKTYWMAS
jgi:hypothetical protein